MKYLQTLRGGRRNRVELFQAGGQKVVVKTIPKRKSFDFYDCEKKTLQNLQSTGLSPQILDYDDFSNKLFMSYVPGVTLADQLESGDVDCVALGRKLAELHAVSRNLKGAFSFHRSPQKDLPNIISLYKKLGLAMSEDVQNELKNLFSNAANYQTSNIHGSLIPSNVIMGANPVFIDFEMASQNSHSLDAAYLSAFLSRNDSTTLLEGYCSVSSKNKELLEREMVYGKYHVCALTLGLYLENMSDVELLRRSQKLRNSLVSFADDPNYLPALSNFFSKIDLDTFTPEFSEVKK